MAKIFHSDKNTDNIECKNKMIELNNKKDDRHKYCPGYNNKDESENDLMNYEEDMEMHELDMIYIQKLYDNIVTEGSSDIKTIYENFENIIDLLLKILSVEVKLYNTSTTSFKEANDTIGKYKNQIDKLFKECGKHVAKYRTTIANVLSNNKLLVTGDQVLVDAFVEYSFTQYMVEIEQIIRCIYIGNGLINAIATKNKDVNYYINIWFGISNENNKLKSVFNTSVSLPPNNIILKPIDTNPAIFDSIVSEIYINPVEFRNIASAFIAQPVLKSIKNGTRKRRYAKKNRTRLSVTRSA